MTRLGWGIAGCGWVARDYVAPAIVDSANGALLAVYDPSEGSRAQARAAFGVPCHGSMAAFLATPGMGAVYVASP
ncbi:MAG: Gfo/Idh/MocA family oxidoreductase, partial [Janthinobacterium lividum]